jgi:hypothetical protein
MARPSDLTAPILQDDWAQLSEVSAALRRGLDDALTDLVRATVEDPPTSYAASCSRIDRAFGDRMAPYWNLDWAVDRATALQHALKEGLLQGPYRSDADGNMVSGS